MTEFQELVKDAPKFVSMERGELVACAYAMYAAGTKVDVENAKLRELVAELYQCSRQCGCDRCGYKDGCAMFDRMAQLGVEVD